MAKDQTERRILVGVTYGQPDIVLLDWMLPKLAGIEVARRLRSAQVTRNLPIIMLTARTEETDRIRGLDIGADDYMTKPFSMSELTARIRAVMRRIRPALADDIVVVGDISMDRAAHKVTRAGVEVHLGPTEFRLLDYFIQHPGRVFSREQLLGRMHGLDSFLTARTIDTHVKNLRRKIETDPRAPAHLVTVYGIGYKLTAGRADAP